MLFLMGIRITPRMSPGWRFARASSFISLRKIPKSRRIKRMVYLLFQESSLERMYVADRGWVISRSEIKEETLMPAGDIRGGG